LTHCEEPVTNFALPRLVSQLLNLSSENLVSMFAFKSIQLVPLHFGKVSRVTLFFPNGQTPSAIISLSPSDAQTAVKSLQGVQLEGCKAPMEINFAGKSDKVGLQKVEFSLPVA
jgi:hypothetical protein